MNDSIPIIPTGFFATCVGCSFSGGLGVRGEFDLDLGLPPKIDKAWVEANTTKAIKALAKVEVILNASIPALPIPLIPEIFFTTWQVQRSLPLPYDSCHFTEKVYLGGFRFLNSSASGRILNAISTWRSTSRRRS